jgi:hypothetical protein
MRSLELVGFGRATICGVTNKLFGNDWLQKRYYMWRHKHLRWKCLASDALLFVAPQTSSLEMVGFRCAAICSATNTFVEKSWLWTRYYLWRHKHDRGKCLALDAQYLWRHKHALWKWLASDALLLLAPQTDSWKIVGFGRDTICGATTVENGRLRTLLKSKTQSHLCNLFPNASHSR